MTEFFKKSLDAAYNREDRDKKEFLQSINQLAIENEYHPVELDDARPWGGFIRLDNLDADRFVGEFFPGLDPVEARLGNLDAPLSPKILLVGPEQRLSWQRHDRRAERWAFLTEGAYVRSLTDEQGDRVSAKAGEVVQFDAGERHRLVGVIGKYVLVAEIWQHVDPNNLSDEDDIVRIADDYQR